MPPRWRCTATVRIGCRSTRLSRRCGRRAPTCSRNIARLPAAASRSTCRNASACLGASSDAMVTAPTPAMRGDRQLLEVNRRFYDLLWSGARLVEPQRFNTWPLVRSLLPESGRRLEVAPGLRPRLPIEGTQFVDITAPALAKLREPRAHVVLGEVTSLPFADDAFDLVCALDIIEHVDDDDGALSELSRVAQPGGTLLISTPLHPARWTSFDDFVGHKRRYEPQQLLAKLAQHQLAVTGS